MDPIAKTSLLTAAMRARETKRSDAEGRLFSDPYAELLAGTEGQAILERALAESGDQPAIAVRTSYMDTKFTAAIQSEVRQVVILAAGMDTRAYRISFPEGTHVFELDRPEVLDYKKQKLSHVSPKCTRHAVPVDLRDDWQGNLMAAGFIRAKQTLWMAEGLLMYLEEPQVMTLFERINAAATTGDIVLFDILSRTLLDAPHMKKQLEFLKAMGAPWLFGINEPEKLMEKFHWKAEATQPGEFLPARWPFPAAPRHIPNVPRSFFVEAIKL